jgi:hypothetical protein
MDATLQAHASSKLTASAWPFVVFGIASVVAGGAISAFTASTPTRQMAWLVAYLVLVVGAAQVGLGAGQARLASRPVASRTVALEFAAFNLGNLAVILGTFSSLPLLVDAGGILLVLSLVYFLWSVRGHSAREGTATSGWLINGYRVLIAILVISIPIGLVLAHIRAD